MTYCTKNKRGKLQNIKIIITIFHDKKYTDVFRNGTEHYRY